MNIVTKRRKFYAEMGFTEFGNGGLFEREREDPVKEENKEEEERSEKRGKVFQSEGDGHDTTRFGGAVWCKKARHK